MKTPFHRNVFLTGLTSFFTDVSSEMQYPLIQAFVSSIFSAQKTAIGPALGIIEGIAESVASLTKIFSGYFSDRMSARKSIAISGYAVSAMSKLLFFLASTGWYFVLFGRFFDRVGKGIRSAPRDALIYESVPKNQVGAAFGFQRAMDFAGATIGVALCYFLCAKFIDPATKTILNLHSFYTIFFISVIPAFIGVVFLFFVKETLRPKDTVASSKPKPNLNFMQYSAALRVFFVAQFIFTLGNSSNQFLLLRSMNLGYALSGVILMYMTFNLSSTLLSSYFGKLSDTIGRKRILLCGYCLFGIVYALFGFASQAQSWILWPAWILYGIYYALCEGVEKAFVSDCAPAESKATALGFFHTIAGIGLLPASVIAGILFSIWPRAPFLFGAFTALVAFVIVAFFVKEKRLS